MKEVQIPGVMSARVKDGRIIGFDFLPSAAHAGYFGPELISEDEIDTEAFWDMVSQKLTTSPDNQTSIFTGTWVC